MVATSHVFYSTGHIQDLAPIAAAARKAGALFIADGYQAVGQIPVDPRALGVDVYVGGPLKWLLGGPGMAFLWVKEERIADLRPTMASWFGARDQFLFEPDSFEFRDDARRYEMGTHALPTMYTALGGLEIVLEIGVEKIRERIAALTADLVGRLEGDGYRLRISPEPARRSGIVMVEHADAGAAVRTLADRNIIVDKRGSFVRVSPHFYNSAEENAEFVRELASL